MPFWFSTFAALKTKKDRIVKRNLHVCQNFNIPTACPIQVLSNSLDPGEVTKEEVHYLQDKRDGEDKCDMI